MTYALIAFFKKCYELDRFSAATRIATIVAISYTSAHTGLPLRLAANN